MARKQKWRPAARAGRLHTTVGQKQDRMDMSATWPSSSTSLAFLLSRPLYPTHTTVGSGCVRTEQGMRARSFTKVATTSFVETLDLGIVTNRRRFFGRNVVRSVS